MEAKVMVPVSHRGQFLMSRRSERCPAGRPPYGPALEDRRLLVGREDLAHDVGDLPHRRVGLDRLDQRRHDVLPVGAGLAQGARGPT